jgi:hypothetical protein
MQRNLFTIAFYKYHFFWEVVIQAAQQEEKEQ